LTRYNTFSVTQNTFDKIVFLIFFVTFYFFKRLLRPVQSNKFELNKDMAIAGLVSAVVIAIFAGSIMSLNIHNAQTTPSENSVTPPVLATESSTQTVSNTSNSNVAPSADHAILPLPTSPVENPSITAQYLGNSNFMSSSSGVLTQLVIQASTTTTVASDANPSVFGQEVTFTATVSPVSPATVTPTGTVTFLIDGTPQTPVALAAGKAAIALSTLSHGTHTVTAQYSGDANFKPSSGNTYPRQ
jgi:hypothetical protein